MWRSQRLMRRSPGGTSPDFDDRKALRGEFTPGLNPHTKEICDRTFTDGCPGLRSILADAGVRKPPILD